MTDWIRAAQCSGGSCVEVKYVTASQCTSGNCFEVGYRTAEHCASGSCVEVAVSDADTVLVRDSKHPEVAPLEFTRDEWDTFVVGVTNGEFRFGGES